MKETYLKPEKGNVFFRVSDDWDPERDTVFFMHGLTADHTMFAAQTAHFEGRYNVLAWDAPAHGRSRPFGRFSFDDSSEYMKRILDMQGVEEVFLVGQSLGGYFAQSFIKRYPGRVRGFVSLDSTPYGSGYYSKSDIWWIRQVEWMSRLYPLGRLKKAMAKQVSSTQAAFDNMTDMLAPYGKDELCRLMGLGYSAFLDDNSDITIPCPVLLILGEKDRTGKVVRYNKEWARRSGYPLRVIKGAAHNVNVDRPDEVNDLIAGFLRDVSDEQI